MNEIEDLLREGMERFTRDLRAPAGLIHRAALRRRRRQRSMAAGAAALSVTAVGLAAAVLPGALLAGPGVADVTAAYVVNHVSRALSAAEPGDIAQIAVTRTAVMPDGKTMTTTAEEWSYGDRWRSVTYSPAGHPVYDEGYGASSIYTLVSYQTRTWARQRGLGRPNAPVFGALGSSYRHAPRPSLTAPPPSPAAALPSAPVSSPLVSGRPLASRPIPRNCEPVIAGVSLLFQPGLPGVGFAATSLPAARALRNAISCGTLAVAGRRQRIDGVEAIKLTSRPDSPISETVWVTPVTYLPVRIVVRSAHGLPVPRQTANITWLRPTARNLARLTVPIPAGFRRVREPLLAVGLAPTLRQILGRNFVPRSVVICMAPADPRCRAATILSGLGLR